MALFGKNEVVEVNPIDKEIEGIHLRKNTITNDLNNDIKNLEADINVLFLNAGQQSFEALESGAEANLKEIWDKVKEHKASIVKIEEKIKEMSDKYEEEITLLRKASMAGASTTGPNCPKCFSPVESDDMFCENCGEKLK